MNFNNHFKFLPKLGTAIYYLVFVLGMLLLFFGRNLEGIRFSILETNFTDFYQHISNLSLTAILFSTVAYVWLLMGVKLRAILLLGIFFIAINSITETWVSVLNTRDPLDLVYGIVGVLIGLVFILSITYLKGLTANPNFTSKTD
tara:strand:+ start:778861 stop:779295 length:435 start_codon:yes stop_codon:yes gene_type:complete